MEPRDAATKKLVHRALGADDDAPAVADRVLDQLRELPATPRIPRWRDGRRSAGRALGSTSTAVVVLVLGNLIAARLVPSYAVELADAPVIGPISAPLLQLTGLTPSQVTPASSSATVDGQTITVVGGFADTSRTVVVIQVDGRNSPLSKTAAQYSVLATLTDQYGHSYSGGGGGDNQELVFQPLVGRAMHGPVRLTLDVTLLVMNSASSPGHPSTQSRFAGNWILGLTVTQHSAVTKTVPAPVTVDGITYAVTSITISGTDVSVDWRASGGSQIAQYWSLTRGPGYAGEPAATNLDFEYFFALIEPPGGSLASTNLGPPPPTSPFDVTGIDVISSELITGQLQQVVPAPGRYLIAIGRPTVVSFPINVP
ncbi:MAG: hypothetical protein WBF51_11100 [Candidatus Dormiibacterota bacterium]